MHSEVNILYSARTVQWICLFCSCTVQSIYLSCEHNMQCTLPYRACTVQCIVILSTYCAVYACTLQVISGQYVCSSYIASVQVEVEVIGISGDCAKQKTKVVPKNALNPIWNDIFTFQVQLVSNCTI